ncbi:MAG TPA: ATP-dependent sacrificial sulfur transferase LarE [Chthoniobacterales bacterium]
MPLLSAKLSDLQKCLANHAPMLVAYSGGVDSTCLLVIAHHVLGNSVTGVIADSPSLPRKALERAVSVAEGFGITLKIIPTFELDNDNYASNPLNRCYFCKFELFNKMDDMAARGQFASLAYGENADDASQIRPGRQAAANFAVIAPLKEAGLTKLEIRRLSREMGLPTAEDPAQPCLSSRVPHGTRVTKETLHMIEQAEEFVRSQGFRVFRVRHVNSHSARVQIAKSEMSTATHQQYDLIRRGLGAVGYRAVEIDPNGYVGAGTM